MKKVKKVKKLNLKSLRSNESIFQKLIILLLFFKHASMSNFLDLFQAHYPVPVAVSFFFHFIPDPEDESSFK